jgi:hypothetical protein
MSVLIPFEAHTMAGKTSTFATEQRSSIGSGLGVSF